jgi:hypothetical protein
MPLIATDQTPLHLHYKLQVLEHLEALEVRSLDHKIGVKHDCSVERAEIRPLTVSSEACVSHIGPWATPGNPSAPLVR